MIHRLGNIALTLLLLLLFLAGCAGSSGFSLGELAKTTTVNGTCEQILKHQPEFQTMNASRISLGVRFGKESHNVRGSLKMYRDSVIQVSIQPLPGVELFRAQLTPGGIVLLDRLNSEFLQTDYDFIRTRFGVEADFYTLQSLLSNQLFLAGRQYLYSSDFEYFRLNPFPDGYMLEAKSGDFKFDHEFTANRSFRIEQATLTDRQNPYFIKFEFQGFEEYENVIFPSKINVVLFNGQTSNFMNITLNSVDFNKPVNVSFAIPKKYKEISL
ncbi:MAG: DUF4292 domain-containing protein [Prevotellaceae bacterium]|nr:DUF4292 domain-containing protein [Prevotellaceae bacterium]